jgi:hypothetical protein
MIYRSEDNVKWEVYKMTSDDEKEMLKVVPGFGDVMKNGKRKPATFRVIPERAKKKRLTRDGKEKTAKTVLVPPAKGIQLSVKTYDGKGNPVFWRYCPPGKDPKTKASVGGIVKTIFPQTSFRLRNMSMLFESPQDREWVWFLATKCPDVRGIRPSSKPYFEFYVPEKVAVEKMEKYKADKAFDDEIMEDTDLAIIGEIHTALGLPDAMTEYELRFAVREFGRNEKFPEQKKRVLDLLQSKKFRSQMLIVGGLKQAGLIRQEATGWFYVPDMQGNPKAKPFAKADSDMALAELAKADDALMLKMKTWLEASKQVA